MKHYNGHITIRGVIDDECARQKQELAMIQAGIFWIITETNELEDFHLLMFGITCDEYGNITDAPVIQPNSKSGKSYNHKTTWEAEVIGSAAYNPYNKNPFDYYPRGRVEIAKKRAVIYMNPNINKPIIIEEIKARFGLGCNLITKIRIIADNSLHYRCFIDKEQE